MYVSERCVCICYIVPVDSKGQIFRHFFSHFSHFEDDVSDHFQLGTTQATVWLSCPLLDLPCPHRSAEFYRGSHCHCSWLLLGKFQKLNSSCEIYTASFFFFSLNYLSDSLFTFKVSFFSFLFGNLCNQPIFLKKS